MASNPRLHSAITSVDSEVEVEVEVEVEGRSLTWFILMVHGTHESVFPTQNHTADGSPHNTQLGLLPTYVD